MRKLIVMAMVAGLVGFGGYAKNASAGATIDLVFVSQNGAAIAATDTVTANPGDTLVMNLVMRNSSQLSIHAFSLQYDTNLTHLAAANWTGVLISKTQLYAPLAAGFTLDSPPLFGTFQSTNGGSTNLFLPANTSPTIAGGYAVGTIGWKVGGSPGQQSILSGLFNSGVDGFGDNNFNIINDQVLFHGATVNVIPEPGTAALLGFGLVGLVLMGRRNRA